MPDYAIVLSVLGEAPSAERCGLEGAITYYNAGYVRAFYSGVTFAAVRLHNLHYRMLARLPGRPGQVLLAGRRRELILMRRRGAPLPRY